jgi:hypothetical protein
MVLGSGFGILGNAAQTKLTRSYGDVKVVVAMALGRRTNRIIVGARLEFVGLPKVAILAEWLPICKRRRFPTEWYVDGARVHDGGAGTSGVQA